MNESTEDLAQHLSSIEMETATALLAITGGTFADAKAALCELTRRNNDLLERGDQAILESLARQTILLEALIANLFESAGSSTDPNITRMALSGALSAQRVLLQTLGALHQVQRHV